MFQRSFAGHVSQVINRMAPCGCRGCAINSRSKDDRKRNPQGVYARSERRPEKFAGVGVSRRPIGYTHTQAGRRLCGEHCKSYQLNRREMRERASVVFAGQIYC